MNGESCYRIFGLSDILPGPGVLYACVAGGIPTATGRFIAGERGWAHAEFAEDGGQPFLWLEHYRRDDEGVIPELQSWAAWLETHEHNPHCRRLMQHITSTQQVFVMRRATDPSCGVLSNHVCLMLCRLLAEITQGVFQVDTVGFFSANGERLVEEI